MRRLGGRGDAAARGGDGEEEEEEGARGGEGDKYATLYSGSDAAAVGASPVPAGESASTASRYGARSARAPSGGGASAGGTSGAERYRTSVRARCGATNQRPTRLECARQRRGGRQRNTSAQCPSGQLIVPAPTSSAVQVPSRASSAPGGKTSSFESGSSSSSSSLSASRGSSAPFAASGLGRRGGGKAMGEERSAMRCAVRGGAGAAAAAGASVACEGKRAGSRCGELTTQSPVKTVGSCPSSSTTGIPSGRVSVSVSSPETRSSEPEEVAGGGGGWSCTAKGGCDAGTGSPTRGERSSGRRGRPRIWPPPQTAQMLHGGRGSQFLLKRRGVRRGARTARSRRRGHLLRRSVRRGTARHRSGPSTGSWRANAAGQGAPDLRGFRSVHRRETGAARHAPFGEEQRARA